MVPALRDWQFWIDVGGTFTDCLASLPTGELRSHKLLSTGVYKLRVEAVLSTTSVRLGKTVDVFCQDFFTGFQLGKGGAQVASYEEDGRQLTFATAQTLHAGDLIELHSGEPAPVTGLRFLSKTPLGQPLGPLTVRLGTTRGTNALLERQGAPVGFLTTRGFRDVLEIAYQNRPKLFDLAIRKALPLYAAAVEVGGRVGRGGVITEPLDLDGVRQTLKELRASGIEALAICLLNAHLSSKHEMAIEALAYELGFSQVSRSSQVAPLQKIVPRGDTTVVDAYLTPVIKDYVAAVRQALPQANLKLMTSAGGLIDASAFRGRDSILSGPAGGAVGVAMVAKAAGVSQAIGFDMGGTSTDVCRFDGDLERRYEMEIRGPDERSSVRLSAPMLAIETVAAGGGSICGFDGIRLSVGPRSAGADPGPACYGKGGPLTITDCNLLLGRVRADSFSFPLDQDAAQLRLDELLRRVHSTGADYTPMQLADGFLAIAASTMAQPIKRISLAKGYDPRTHALVSFGGAGAQHACQLADELGITRILQHEHASLLSAYGMGGAFLSRFAARDVGEPLATAQPVITRHFGDMRRDLRSEFQHQEGLGAVMLVATESLDLRYRGQDSVITLERPQDGDYQRAFVEAHKQQFGFELPARPVEVRTARLCMHRPGTAQNPVSGGGPTQAALSQGQAVVAFAGEPRHVEVYDRSLLRTGDEVAGPALIFGAQTTVVVASGWQVCLRSPALLDLTRVAAVANSSATMLGPVALELFSHRLEQIAEAMGTVLRRTWVSVNVKERLDFSCAVFAANGDLAVNAPHIPVHLGSMGDTVRAMIKEFGPNLPKGQVYITNDPYRGGSHLPDVTVVTPVHSDAGELLFFTGNRAHHAEIGGITPGSMPPNATTLADEGVLLRPFAVVDQDGFAEQKLRHLLSTAPFPSRSVDDNIADVKAQIAANELGRQKLLQLVDQLGKDNVKRSIEALSAIATKQLQEALLRLAEGPRHFADQMDDGTAVQLTLTIEHRLGHADGARAVLDFTGTGPVAAGNLNANTAIVKAAALYAFRCLVGAEMPLNEGLLKPLHFIIPTPSLISPQGGTDPKELPAVTAGNVETSQRLVDVLLGALGLAAASQGTMNNFLFGRSADADGPGFGYYETICGGSGASRGHDGASAVHTHMTNTRITDPEVLEERFPVRLETFAIRRGSGGAGRWRGGDGVVRKVVVNVPLTVSLITSRRLTQPYGMEGGEAGARGENLLWRAGVTLPEVLPPMAQVELAAGDSIELRTPGGGGFGKSEA